MAKLEIFDSKVAVQESKTPATSALTLPLSLATQQGQGIQAITKAVGEIQNDIINQSLLLEAKGQGERLKGDLTARTEYMKAAGSLLTMGYKSYDAGRLVIT